MCEQALGGAACENPICKFEDRWFARNHAIAMHTGALKAAISRYKYQNRWGWAHIFARVLVGYLEGDRPRFEGFDLITSSPSYVDPETDRKWDHTRLVLEQAAALSPGAWPIDVEGPPVIEKTAATTPMAAKSWRVRHTIATGELRSALRLRDPERTRDKAILVYDDVFTDGHTLDEVARCVRVVGQARVVVGVSLARAPWRGGR